MKNRQNLIPIIGIALLALVLVSNIISTRLAGPPAFTVPTPTPTPREMGVYYNEGQIIDAMEKNLEELFPGRWDLFRYMSGDHSIVDVRIYSDSVAALRDLAVGGVANMPQQWDSLVESTRTSSKNWHEAFELNHVDGIMVQIGEYDESDPETPCFMCINGVTALDPVHGIDLYADIEAALAEAEAGGVA